MAPVWTIVSGKGGVGKSTLAASLAVGLAKRRLPVVLIDMDTGLRNQDMLLGLENRVMFDLVDVVDGNAELDQALVHDPLRPNFALLSSSQIHEGAAVSLESFRRIVDVLRERFAHVIVDCPPGVGISFRMCTAVATDVIVCVTPDEVALRDADRVAGLLRQHGNPALWLVVNRLRADWVRNRSMYAPNVIAQTLDIPLAGALYEDEEVLRCQIARKAVIESDAVIWQLADEILRRLLGEKVPFKGLPQPGGPKESGKRFFGKKRR